MKMTQKHFDDILTGIGTGKWNLLILLGFSFCGFMVPSFVLAGSFLTPIVAYSCNVPQGDDFEDLDNCHYTSSSVASDGTTIKLEEKCSNWTFEDKNFPTSLTESFELVCDRSYLRPTYQTVYMLGTFISAPINGFLSDRYGRKNLFSFGVIAAITSTFASSFLLNFTAHLVIRFIVGMAHPAIIQTGYILCMEICEKKYRSLVGILISLPWALGTIFWGIIGYYIDDWRWLFRTSIIPGLICVIFFLWIMDESPRWLIVNGQHQKALQILKKAAKWNNATLPPDDDIGETMIEIQKSSFSTSDRKESICNESKTWNKKAKKVFKLVWILYKTPELRRITLLTYVMFFVASTVYYGLSLNAVNFKLNPYVYMMVSGITEIPAYTVTIPIVARLGRIIPTVVFFFVCGVTIMTLAFIPSDPTWVVITFAMVGKFCIASAYQIIYLMASEIFPTEVRLQALGTSNFVSRIGSILAPYVTDLLGPIYPWFPSVAFGSLSLIAGVAAYFVPETLNKHLPETIYQLEEEAKVQKRMKFGRRCSKAQECIDLEQ